MPEKFFNPNQQKYEEAEDLPKGQQKNYANVDGGGFVAKSAIENDKIAEIAARFKRISGAEVVETEARDFDRERDHILKKLDVAEMIKNSGEYSKFIRPMNETRLDIEYSIDFSPHKKELYDSEEVMLKYAHMRGVMVIYDLSERLKNDKAFILKLLVQDTIGLPLGGIITHLPKSLTSDMEVIMTAMKTDPVGAFSVAPENKRSDLVFIGEALDSIEKHYKSDMRQAAMNSLLDYVSPGVREDILSKMGTVKKMEQRAA